MTDYKIRKSLLVFSFAAFAFFICYLVSPAKESFSGSGQDGLLRLAAASQSGGNSLILERDLRDALISNPPFSGPAPEVAAQAPPPAPVQVQPAYAPSAPAPPPGIPEVYVRGYSMDPTGAINIVGTDGVMRQLDGSQKVKLIFPPEYRLAPQIVGGARQAAPPPPPTSSLVEIAVRGYSIEPSSGAINIIGMDGVMRRLDGSQQVKLVFPPEYGLAPQIVGGGSAAPASGGQIQAYSPGTGVPVPQQPAGAAPPQVVIIQQQPPPAPPTNSAADVLQGVGSILQGIRGR